MISFEKIPNIYLAREIADLRKGIDGYCALVVEAGMDPYSSDLYLFTNRHHNKLKGIIFDETSMWMIYRRLDKGTFQWKLKGDDLVLVSQKQFAWLLQGLSIYQKRAFQEEKPDFF